jgi:hypothetical protein
VEAKKGISKLFLYSLRAINIRRIFFTNERLIVSLLIVVDRDVQEKEKRMAVRMRISNAREEENEEERTLVVPSR